MAVNSDDRFKLLPPGMGFEQEEWFHETGNHGPHYTCVVNGQRVCVWVDTHPQGYWHLQLASYSYHTSESWGMRTVPDSLIDVPIGDVLTLQAMVHHITSGGNDG